MKRSTKLSFRILKTSRTSRARLGILKTPHGTVRTPAYVIVATHGTVRTLAPADLKKSKTQLVIANTYHLWDAERNAVRKRLKHTLPTMTDSGGFQVFSLGAAKEHGVGKVLRQPVRAGATSNVRITEEGATITLDGAERVITPESSIQTQERLGADIIFAFDECTSPLHPYAYQKTSMGRTHRWAERCIQAHTRKDQLLYGIVQGGRFKRLRTASAKAIGNMPFGGFGIGGSFGRDEMRASLAAVIPHLPDEKPRHLLGIGTVRDIFDAIEAGVDTFDCVIPTREARHGRLYTDNGAIDIRKTIFANDKRKLLGSRRTFGILQKLFRARDPEAGHLATLHNVMWFNELLTRIRAALADGSYGRLKRQTLTRFSSR